MKGRRSLSASRASERLLKLVRNHSTTLSDDNLGRKSTGSNKLLRKILSKKTRKGSIDDNEINDNNFRIIFLGASSVGKTSIISQFLGGMFPSKYKQTLQDIFVGQLELGGSTLLLSIEDTGGSYIQDFPAMARLSLDNSDGAVLVFSVDEAETFEEVSRIRDFLLSYWPSMPMVIVGNKIDKERKLPAMEIEAMVCLDWECSYVECSARDRVEEIFKEIASQAKIVQKYS